MSFFYILVPSVTPKKEVVKETTTMVSMPPTLKTWNPPTLKTWSPNKPYSNSVKDDEYEEDEYYEDDDYEYDDSDDEELKKLSPLGIDPPVSINFF